MTSPTSSLDGLAARAAGRLGSMTLDEQRETLGLLNVRVEVLDNTKAPALRITGTVADLGLPRNPDGQELGCGQRSVFFACPGIAPPRVIGESRHKDNQLDGPRAPSSSGAAGLIRSRFLRSGPQRRTSGGRVL
jgi:hypothetical protein